ncbi:hypothetical protein ARALYDRAFT_897246 [Arabidopsis lyrata subsp. lyrata]|uniref:Non-specific serine/threonine protein kinase n=1 Tax=Arabidopsis lyrata subsp. lyrata TaxID=81972 RepID=D7L909_ARALL|nr:hypothetical protein ARALYDRAFT_897246 [Arabidopsis lyrata subsp. lyrata]
MLTTEKEFDSKLALQGNSSSNGETISRSKSLAFKIMDKKFITKENKTAYVKLERIVLDPGIVKLFFTFQDTQSLCR